MGSASSWSTRETHAHELYAQMSSFQVAKIVRHSKHICILVRKHICALCRGTVCTSLVLTGGTPIQDLLVGPSEANVSSGDQQTYFTETAKSMSFVIAVLVLFTSGYNRISQRIPRQFKINRRLHIKSPKECEYVGRPGSLSCHWPLISSRPEPTSWVTCRLFFSDYSLESALRVAGTFA
jgi:hypothetical protein